MNIANIILILKEFFWQFKRDEEAINNNGAFINLTAENSSSFKYKSIFIGDTVEDRANRKKEGVK